MGSQTYSTEPLEPIEGRFVVKWDALLRGLEISFEHEGKTHRSLLPWERLDEIRRDLLNDIWAHVPKVTEGVASDQEPTNGL